MTDQDEAVGAASTTAAGPPEDGDDYELITKSGQLDTPPELPKEWVPLPEWPTKKGKKAAFWVHGLDGPDYAKFLEDRRVYDDEGRFVRNDVENDDARTLAFCCRDKSGRHRVWKTTADAVAELRGRHQASLDALLAAAQRVSRRGGVDAARAEGNSEPTQTAA